MSKVTDLLCSGLSLHFLRKIPSDIACVLKKDIYKKKPKKPPTPQYSET